MAIRLSSPLSSVNVLNKPSCSFPQLGKMPLVHQSSPNDQATPRCLAFYLPQFHPIPENDAAWGEGFTDWTNVARGRPLFSSHYQPHIPANLGFYDLRRAETRAAQADLAATYGIHGFVYYHYWFGGRQVLQTPLQEVLRTGEPRFPFCLAWANESWTRNWDGSEVEVLIEQHYSLDDDLAHIRALRAAICDDRYVRWDGKPVLLVYRANQLPEPCRTTDIWRKEAEAWGLPGLYLLRVESFPDELGDPTKLGFDGAVEFQPRAWACSAPDPLHVRASTRARAFLSRTRSPMSPTYHLLSYESFVRSAIGREPPGYVRWPCACPGWDNSPRRATGATILLGNSPELYSQWLSACLKEAQHVAGELGKLGEGLVFVNAWNEWAEGNHLEPDLKYGLAFLRAHRDTLVTFGREGIQSNN